MSATPSRHRREWPRSSSLRPGRRITDRARTRRLWRRHISAGSRRRRWLPVAACRDASRRALPLDRAWRFCRAPRGRIRRARGGLRDELPQIGKSLLHLRRIEHRRPRRLAGGGALAGRPLGGCPCRLLAGFTGCPFERHRAFARRGGFLFERQGPLARRRHFLLERHRPPARGGDFLLERRRPLACRGDILLELHGMAFHALVSIDDGMLLGAHGAAEPERQPRRDAERRNGHDGGNEAYDHGSVHERRPSPKLIDIHAHQLVGAHPRDGGRHRALPMRVVVERAMYRFAVVRRRLLINRRGQTTRQIVTRRAAAGCDKNVVRSAQWRAVRPLDTMPGPAGSESPRKST